MNNEGLLLMNVLLLIFLCYHHSGAYGAAATSREIRYL